MASPAVEVEARLAGRADTLRVIGLDLFRAAAIQPGLVAAAGEGLDMLRPDAIFLSAAALSMLGVARDDSLALQVGLGEVRAARRRPARRRRRRARSRRWTSRAPRRCSSAWGGSHASTCGCAPGVDPQRFIERHAATTAARASRSIAPKRASQATESVSRSYRVNLNVLALVALFTGGLLVFSTQALGVVRRRAQFALLRVLGVTRGRLARLVAFEGALIGIAGSALGVVAGYAIAQLAVRLAGSRPRRGILPRRRAVAPRRSVGARDVLRARRRRSAAGQRRAGTRGGARIAGPALKAGDEETALARLRSPVAGLALFALGALLVGLPPIDGLPLAGYVAIALPAGRDAAADALACARWCSRACRCRRSAAPALALAQLRGAPGQVAVSLASIVAA